MKRTFWEEVKLFWQFATGSHYIVRERVVL
jgi:hypothetical protein